MKHIIHNNAKLEVHKHENKIKTSNYPAGTTLTKRSKSTNEYRSNFSEMLVNPNML